MITKIGITGSRYGMAKRQGHAIHRILPAVAQRADTQPELHHGDCTGVDAEVAMIAQDYGFLTVGYPPLVAKFRAFYPSDVTLPPDEYLARDRAIVDAVDLLIGFPATDEEQAGSGTWYTINYGLSIPTKKVLVIGPTRTLNRTKTEVDTEA